MVGVNSSSSVSSPNNIIFARHFPCGLAHTFDKAFSLVWKARVPCNIRVFGWRILINKLLTKDPLNDRGLNLPLDSCKCVFCGVVVKSLDHLLLLYSDVILIWKEVAD